MRTRPLGNSSICQSGLRCRRKPRCDSSWRADNPRHKHGGHRYELSDFGLELGAIRERFEAYCERYAIPLVM